MNEAQKLLYKMYREAKFGSRDPLRDDMGGQPGRLHDWRNYVSQFRDIWHELPHEARIIAALIAEEAADREEWN